MKVIINCTSLKYRTSVPLTTLRMKKYSKGRKKMSASHTHTKGRI